MSSLANGIEISSEDPTQRFDFIAKVSYAVEYIAVFLVSSPFRVS